VEGLTEMRVYVKENVRYMGNGEYVPDGTFYALSGATLACVASGMSLTRITEWCGEHNIGIIGIVYYDPSLVRN
jgi:hypothetical protein